MPLVGDGTDTVSNDALETLRTEILPATVGKVAGVQYAVTGDTASSKDWNDKMKSSAPIVFVFVLSFAFLLLLVSFRSIVIPVKAIVMNLLSVGAAYGLLVATFQWGWGANLLDFQKNGGIASWLPMFLFVILFGLSMDYHVFILSRVKEYFDRGMSTEKAVEAGIRSTAGVVTERGRRDGVRLRRLRADADHRHEGDGHRPRSRRPDRRHDRPRGAAARDDEAPRRVELVPADVARVAADARARALDRSPAIDGEATGAAA